MKRKVIQIANSTQLISLPRKWAQKYAVKKGDELEIKETGAKLMIENPNITSIDKREMNINHFGIMSLRFILALYKKGVDEIRITYNKPEDLKIIQKSIGKEAIGYEIIDQGTKYCIVKNISGSLNDFDNIMKRTLLLLKSMGVESLPLIKNKDFSSLRNIAFLEEANNRFTTTCRRAINKGSIEPEHLPGPLYALVEELENIADQYKYLLNYLHEQDPAKTKIRDDIFELHEKTNFIVGKFCDLFENYDHKMLEKIGAIRKKAVQQAMNLFSEKLNPAEIVYVHHMFNIAQRTFNNAGPLMILKS